ncbi:MAG: DUF805 domain-containing protein [Asticcacaulis sp.]
MTFVQAIQSGFKNYANFATRSSRSEYWWWFLFYVLVMAVPETLANGEITSGHMGLFTGLSNLIGLALLLPNLGVAVRRLHDTGRSGWWVLIALTIIGIIFLIIWYCQPGKPETNKYGSNPLGGGPTAVF